MTIDLFSVRPHDEHTFIEVIDLLTQHCDVSQVEHFLADLERWHRLQHQRAPRRHRAATEVELRQWQEFINRLPEVTS